MYRLSSAVYVKKELSVGCNVKCFLISARIAKLTKGAFFYNRCGFGTDSANVIAREVIKLAEKYKKEHGC